MARRRRQHRSAVQAATTPRARPGTTATVLYAHPRRTRLQRGHLVAQFARLCVDALLGVVDVVQLVLELPHAVRRERAAVADLPLDVLRLAASALGSHRARLVLGGDLTQRRDAVLQLRHLRAARRAAPAR